VSSSASPEKPVAPSLAPAAVRSALLRFRVLAFVVGVTLLVFCVAMILKYGFQQGDDRIVAQAHGFLFMIYVVLAFDLAFRLRWSLVRMFFMVISGMIPFLSFVAERKVTHWVAADLAIASTPAAS